ncbi:hypothetical protein IFR04_009820 [Cadophora malorum]|uniref:Uncharacterized protein n=1 Tax=Cadophora malorum TaxID=108018 RepID=A0A8H7WA15_9HELO|nr:hypothetical protein IFR04_009820 [Cadophora malorum]
MTRSSLTREIRLPARYRDDLHADMSSAEKRSNRKQVKKKKSALTEPVPPRTPERVGNARPASSIVQKKAVTSPAALLSSPAQQQEQQQPSVIDWRTVKRRRHHGTERPIHFNGIEYPFNRWSLLTRPGIKYAILKVLSMYFNMEDTLQLLHLHEREIEDLEGILHEEHKQTKVEIEDCEVVYAKRILMANIEDDKLVGEFWRVLDAYKGVTTCLAEIEGGKYDRREEVAGAVEGEGADVTAGEQESP